MERIEEGSIRKIGNYVRVVGRKLGMVALFTAIAVFVAQAANKTNGVANSIPAAFSGANTPQNPSPNARPTWVIPGGTVLPIRLNATISSGRNKANDPVSGSLMQDVALPNGTTIRKGARVNGHVVEAIAGSATEPGRISIQFDNLISRDAGSTPIHANLRAMAGFMALLEAQTPATGPDRGTPSNWWNTTPVGGGETAYGVGGPVVNEGSVVVGRATSDGIVAGTRAPEGSPCRSDVEGNDRPQSLWFFSSEACGVYGMGGVRIVHAGRNSPKGVIELANSRGALKLPRGTGMLLRVQTSTGTDQT